MKKIIFILSILILLISCTNTSSNRDAESGIEKITMPIEEETIISEEKVIVEPVKFSKSSIDVTNDLISLHSEKIVNYNSAIDIVSARINQTNGVVIVNIELSGDVSNLKNELRIGDFGMSESYQYQLWVEIDDNWESMLFGDITDVLGVTGGCGASYFTGSNIHSFKENYCENSQVYFTINKNKIVIKGPLKSRITNFNIKTLYQSGTLTESDLMDEMDFLVEEELSTFTETESPVNDDVETLKFPCNGRAGSSFYLFSDPEGWEPSSKKIYCNKDLQVLERKCFDEWGAPGQYEMNKVKQGDLIGWAQRSDLTCPNVMCDVAPDTIC